MGKASGRLHFLCAVFLFLSVAVGCSSRSPSVVTSTSRGALTTTNGLNQNGLTTNGLVENGFWINGFWINGFWINGFWINGFWINGAWTNGFWINGFWINGAWENGLWSNGFWINGLDGTPNVAGQMLRSNPYARQLLQYVYSCAMPAGVDATLDPNLATPISCTPGAAGADGGLDSEPDGGSGCDLGYACSSEGRCVIPLQGGGANGSGLAINSDGTTWWGQPAPGGATDTTTGKWGQCDESCQRWVSACVLARTNAYGVHVQLSMRAPADAPDPIKIALAVGDDERAGFTLREGAYYGNIFATTPTSTTQGSCTTLADGTVACQPVGPVASTPQYYACAGPGSNIPEITKRFCSSQGDQSVINVPGVCLPTATESGTCSGEDNDSTSSTVGAIQDCHTAASASALGQCADYRDPSCFNEVLTVYLKTPIAVCGNGVCEDDLTATSPETAATCPSDCHPVGWAQSFTNVTSGLQGISGSDFHGSSALSPIDNTVVLVGQSIGGGFEQPPFPQTGNPFFVGTDASFGGPVLPASDGNVLLAKYTTTGQYLWSTRFNMPDTGQGNPIVTVSDDGSIFVSGLLVSSPEVNALVRLAKLTSDGHLVSGWPIILGINTFGGTTQIKTDSAGAVFLAGILVDGDETIETTPPTTLSGDSDGRGVFVVKLLPDGTPVWATSIPGGIGNTSVTSLAIAPSGDLLLALDFRPSSTETAALYRVAANGQSSVMLRSSAPSSLNPDGSSPPPPAHFESVAADGSGDLYVTGYLSSTYDFGPGCGVATSTTGSGEFFLARYSSDGAQCRWLKRATTECPDGAVYCASGLFQGGALTFDHDGNVLVGGTLNSLAGATGPGSGAIVDFGAGPFPTYRYPNPFVAAYGSNDGSFLWAKQIPIVLQGNLEAMNIDGDNNVFVSGIYTGSMQIDGRLLIDTIPELNDDQHANTYLGSFAVPPTDDTMAPSIGAVAIPGAVGEVIDPQINTVPSNIVAQATAPAAPQSSSCRRPRSTPATPGPASLARRLPIRRSPSESRRSAASHPIRSATRPPRHSRRSTSPSWTRSVPVFTTFGDITIQATNPSGAVVPYTVTATDQVDGSRSVTCTPPSGSTFPVGQTTVTCTATDNQPNPNQSSTTFSVNVTPPPITVTCVGTPTSPALLSTSPGVCGATVNASDAGSCSAGASGSASCTFDGASSETLRPRGPLGARGWIGDRWRFSQLHLLPSGRRP